MMLRSMTLSHRALVHVLKREQHTAAVAAAAVEAVRPLFPNEPAGPVVRTAIPGPRSNALLVDLNNIQNTSSVAFFTDYVNSRGNFMMDADGNILLDLMMQIASIPIGYNHPAFIRAMRDPSNLSHLINRPSLGVNPPVDWADRLNKSLMVAAPSGMKNVQTMMCGACSNEHAYKAAFMAYRRRQRGGAPPSEEELTSCLDGQEPGCPQLTILSFEKAFHGRTTAALTCTHTKWSHRLDFPSFDWPVAPFPQLKYPLEDHVAENRREEVHCLQEVRRKIEEYNNKGAFVAGVLIEPIQAEGGDRHATPEFFRELQQVCKEFNAYYLVDEVQTGMGTAGEMWLHETWNLPTPADAVIFSKKAMTGGFFHVDELRPQEGYRIFNTWMGDPHKIVLLETLMEVIARENLIDNARSNGKYVVKGMNELAAEFPDQIHSARGKGHFLAVDARDGKHRDFLQSELLKRGLIVGGSGVTALRMRPSLVFQQHHADMFLDALHGVLHANK